MRHRTGREKAPIDARPPRRAGFLALVVLATLGAWWLLPSYASRMLPWPVAQATRLDYLLAGTCGLFLAVLWGLAVFGLTRAIFQGEATRRRAVVAAATGALLFAMLAALELRSIHVGGQPAEVIGELAESETSPIPFRYSGSRSA